MTGMEHAIEKAARVMARAYFGEPVEHDDMECATECARALADSGLLAPAPLREEWAVEMGTNGPRELFPSRAEAQAFAHDDETVLCRYRTDWTPVDRAEGDGSADQ